MEQAIIVETVEGIAGILGGELDRIRVERAVVGLFFTGVKLSGGTAGGCATPLGSIRAAVCCPPAASAMRFPGTLRGRPARELLDGVAVASGIDRALATATMNALAALCWERRPGADIELRRGVDAYAAAEIRPGEEVVVVGAFAPFLKSLKAAGQRFTVLELDPATLKPDERPHYRPADAAAEVLPQADIVLVTGTTLLNDTLERLLALCPPRARVVVVGPTVSLLPDAFFRRGVDVLGGILVTRPDEFLDVLAEGGTGKHFLGRSAEKVVLQRRAAGPAAVAARGDLASA